MYQYKFHLEAEKELIKLNRSIQILFTKTLKKIIKSPELGLDLGHKNNYDLTGLKKIYFDNKRYGIVYKVIDKEIIIYIIAIGKRDKMNVYKKASDSSPEKAREKALNIFETINNRGMSLSDSDIFKAKLYLMALNKLKHEDFIERWKILDEECQNIEHSINDIFRFYTHIIRANNKITKSEIGLREFYTQKEYSPFKKKSAKYDEILDDLFKMIDIIKFFREIVRTPQKNQELTKWFQLIDLYSNQYPLNTLFVFLYVKGLGINQELIDFSRNLVKYIYYQGATTKIKFHLFEINSSIINGEQKRVNSPTNILLSDFNYFGQLKKGFALLSLYLNNKESAIYPYYINRIINSRDVKELNSSWEDMEYSEYVDTIGNMLIIDKDISRDVKLSRKIPKLKQSYIREIRELAKVLPDWTYQQYTDRTNLLKERLKNFFEGKID